VARLALAALVLVVVAHGATAARTPEAFERLQAFDRFVRAVTATDNSAVRSRVAPFARGDYRVILNATVDRGLGVLAVGKGSRVFAAPMRQKGGVWKVEIVPGFTVEAVRPLPGERVDRRTQLAAEVIAPGKILGALMWFDGRPFQARLYWSPNGRRMSMWEEAPQPLRSRRHTVVALAATRGAASAAAWTFTVRGRGSGSR
jgi:hypothetical protein